MSEVHGSKPQTLAMMQLRRLDVYAQLQGSLLTVKHLWLTTYPHESTRWTSKVSLARNFEHNVIKLAPHEALKLIQLTFDKRVVLHRVECRVAKIQHGDDCIRPLTLKTSRK